MPDGAVHVLESRENVAFDEPLEARRKQRPRYAEIAHELLEGVYAEVDVAEDQRSPGIADDIQGACQGAMHVGEWTLRHEARLVSSKSECRGGRHIHSREGGFGGQVAGGAGGRFSLAVARARAEMIGLNTARSSTGAAEHQQETTEGRPRMRTALSVQAN